MRNIDKVIKKLNHKKLPLTIEKDVFHFLGIYIKRDGDDKIILLQVRIFDKVIKTVVMEDCHAKDNPAQSMPFSTNASGELFD